jgi:hypothetical protein
MDTLFRSFVAEPPAPLPFDFVPKFYLSNSRNSTPIANLQCASQIVEITANYCL